jgi:hypothetical protein
MTLIGERQLAIIRFDGHTTITWLTVPEPPLALRPIQPTLTQLFSPHGSYKGWRDYTRLYGIAKKKIEKCKGPGKDFAGVI